jgi:hypothetical protein
MIRGMIYVTRLAFDSRKRTVLRGWIDQLSIFYGMVREACEPGDTG